MTRLERAASTTPKSEKTLAERRAFFWRTLGRLPGAGAPRTVTPSGSVVTQNRPFLLALRSPDSEGAEEGRGQGISSAGKDGAYPPKGAPSRLVMYAGDPGQEGSPYRSAPQAMPPERRPRQGSGAGRPRRGRLPGPRGAKKAPSSDQNNLRGISVSPAR